MKFGIPSSHNWHIHACMSITLTTQVLTLFSTAASHSGDSRWTATGDVSHGDVSVWCVGYRDAQCGPLQGAVRGCSGKGVMCVVWCSAWCGVMWYGVVWCGVVWCGVVWCGVVFTMALRLGLERKTFISLSFKR